MTKTIHSISINTKRYPYVITNVSETIVNFYCQAAGINQEFMKKDIVELLNDLPEWIKDHQLLINENKQTTIRFRITINEKIEIEKKASILGITVSEYLRKSALSPRFT